MSIHATVHPEDGDRAKFNHSHNLTRWIEIADLTIFPPQSHTEANEFLESLIRAAHELRAAINRVEAERVADAMNARRAILSALPEETE